jgi:carboxylesterase type B
MVWVHGGSNKGGWSYEPNYIGTNLAARGAVVVTLGAYHGTETPFVFDQHDDWLPSEEIDRKLLGPGRQQREK